MSLTIGFWDGLSPNSRRGAFLFLIYELRITNYDLRITIYELRITNYELRITIGPSLLGEGKLIWLFDNFGSLTIFVVVMFTKLILLYISLGEATTFGVPGMSHV